MSTALRPTLSIQTSPSDDNIINAPSPGTSEEMFSAVESPVCNDHDSNTTIRGPPHTTRDFAPMSRYGATHTRQRKDLKDMSSEDQAAYFYKRYVEDRKKMQDMSKMIEDLRKENELLQEKYNNVVESSYSFIAEEKEYGRHERDQYEEKEIQAQAQIEQMQQAIDGLKSDAIERDKAYNIEMKAHREKAHTLADALLKLEAQMNAHGGPGRQPANPSDFDNTMYGSGDQESRTFSDVFSATLQPIPEADWSNVTIRKRFSEGGVAPTQYRREIKSLRDGHFPITERVEYESGDDIMEDGAQKVNSEDEEEAENRIEMDNEGNESDGSDESNGSNKRYEGDERNESDESDEQQSSLTDVSGTESDDEEDIEMPGKRKCSQKKALEKEYKCIPKEMRLVYQKRVRNIIKEVFRIKTNEDISTKAAASLEDVMLYEEGKHEGPRLDDLKLYPQGRLQYRWNRQVIELLGGKMQRGIARHPKTLLPRSREWCEKEMKIRVVNLMEIWNQAQPQARADGALETIKQTRVRLKTQAQVMNQGKRRTTRRHRRYNARKTKIDNLIESEASKGASTKEIAKLKQLRKAFVEFLGEDGVSSDETDFEMGRTVYRVKKMPWRNRSLIKYIDELEKVCLHRGGRKKGPQETPRHRWKDGQEVPEGFDGTTKREAVTGLPQVLYDKDYMNDRGKTACINKLKVDYSDSFKLKDFDFKVRP